MPATTSRSGTISTASVLRMGFAVWRKIIRSDLKEGAVERGFGLALDGNQQCPRQPQEAGLFRPLRYCGWASPSGGRSSDLTSKKVQLNVDSVSHWMATNNARDNLKKRDYFDRFGIADGLRRLAEDHPI